MSRSRSIRFTGLTDPLQGVNVYLFTGSGSYQGINQPTDANGQVTFNVPEKDYKVRADYMSQQYWSDVFSWQDVEVDINHGTAVLHVTEASQDLYDVPVYLFTETGSYLSRMERTDTSGQVQFLLPSDSYKFRVDYEGTQYWSDVISVLPHEENSIDLQLELLADLTHDPNPDRFDGMPPVYEPEKIMVASFGSIRGLLVQSVVGQTTETQKIYYFINDHLGTPQKLLDENADVVWNADYKPFGEADVDVNVFANQFRFPGQYFDAESVLHYNYHRYYDPGVGRYLRSDPIGLAGMDPNIYGYVLNDPVNMVDPFGLESILPGSGFPDYKPTNVELTSNQIIGGFIIGSGVIIATGGIVITGAILYGEGALSISSVGLSLAMIPHTLAIGGSIIGVGGTFIAIGWNMFNEDGACNE